MFPGKFLEDVDFRIPSNDPACPECGAIDPNLKPFRQQELVGGIEHELGSRMAVSARYVHKQVDRAIEDVGVIVPGLGEVFYIANPGEGVATTIEAADCPTCPGLPKIQRDYDAMELKLTRRFANNWSGGISYTLSRLYGNYPGLASSDEIARVAPNVTRLFDGLVMAFRPGGEAVYGRLNTDRPNQFKLNGVYVLPSQTTLAGVFRAASGIPITRQVNMISSLPVFYNGRLSDGRTPWLTLTDLSVQQDIPMPGSRVGAAQPERVEPVRSEGRHRRVPRPDARESPGSSGDILRRVRRSTANREHCRDPHRSAVPPGQCMAGGA